MTEDQIKLLEEAEHTNSFPVTIADGITYFAWNSRGWKIVSESFSRQVLEHTQKFTALDKERPR